MQRSKPAFGWGLLLGVVLLAVAALPTAWAMPSHPQGGTVPTRTPTPGHATNTPLPPAATTVPVLPTTTVPAPTVTVAPIGTVAVASPTATRTVMPTATVTARPSLTPTGRATLSPGVVDGNSGSSPGAATVSATPATESPSITPSPTAHDGALAEAGADSTAVPDVQSERGVPSLLIVGVLLVLLGGAAVWFTRR